MHYLKLAYLAEIAIVFNLAYIELKWKKEFSELTDKMKNLSSLTLTSINRGNHDSVCNKSQCKKCDNPQHIKDKINKYESNHLEKMVSIISSGSNQNNQKALSEAWGHAECNGLMKWLLSRFHFFANRFLDRTISSISLFLASIILVIITMVDNDIDLVFNLMGHLKLWDAPVCWSFWLFNFLLALLVIPGIFWLFWKIFLKRYECLSFVLINAYQEKTSGEFNKSVSNLPM